MQTAYFMLHGSADIKLSHLMKNSNFSWILKSGNMCSFFYFSQWLILEEKWENPCINVHDKLFSSQDYITTRYSAVKKPKSYIFVFFLSPIELFYKKCPLLQRRGLVRWPWTGCSIWVWSPCWCWGPGVRAQYRVSTATGETPDTGSSVPPRSAFTKTWLCLCCSFGLKDFVRQSFRREN